MKSLPNINTRTPLSSTDHEFLQNTTSDEIQTRTRILSDYGIVSEIPTDNEDSPLYVKEITGGIEITPGNIVTPQGNYIESKDSIVFEEALFEIGQEYVVFAEYFLVGTDKSRTIHDTFECKFYKRADKVDQRVNAAQYSVDTHRCENDYNAQAGKIIKYAKSEDYLDQKIFDKDRLLNMVILAYLVRGTDDIRITLSVEGRRDLRPWFSAKDISHRSKIGSGLSTDNNPHGLALEDLTAGDLSLYEMLQTNGCIIAKDKDFTTIPGRHVFLEYPLSDNPGDIVVLFRTNGDNLNVNNNNTRPFRVMKVTDENKWYEFAFNYNAAEGILKVFGAYGAAKLLIDCFVVDACTPYQTDREEIKFHDPSVKEIIISDGITLKELSENSIKVSGNIIPKVFYIYVTKEGTFLQNPKPHGTYPIYNMEVDKENVINLTDEREFNVELIFSDALNIDVDMELTGVDNNGNETKESFNTKTDSTLLNNQAVHILSKNKWKEIKSWTITNINYLPSDTEMTLYEKYTTKETNPMMLTCKVEHSRDTGITRIYDLRDIKPGLNNDEPINVDIHTMAIEKGKLLRYVDVNNEQIQGLYVQNAFEHASGGMYKSTMIPINYTLTSNFGITASFITVAVELAEDISKYDSIGSFLDVHIYESALNRYDSGDFEIVDKIVGNRVLREFRFIEQINHFVYGVIIHLDCGFKNYGVSVEERFFSLGAPA